MLLIILVGVLHMHILHMGSASCTSMNFYSVHSKSIPREFLSDVSTNAKVVACLDC